MMTNKTALITGAMGGIRQAIARALASTGCNLMLNDIGNLDAHRAGVPCHYNLVHGLDVSGCKLADATDSSAPMILSSTGRR